MAIQPADHDRGKLSESGIYTIPFAARLLSARPERVRSWVEGYGNALPILSGRKATMGGGKEKPPPWTGSGGVRLSCEKSARSRQRNVMPPPSNVTG